MFKKLKWKFWQSQGCKFRFQFINPAFPYDFCNIIITFVPENSLHLNERGQLNSSLERRAMLHFSKMGFQNGLLAAVRTNHVVSNTETGL